MTLRRAPSRPSRRSPPHFAQQGIQPGDRVAGYLPNVPEAIVAALGAAAVGAVWSSCSPDFGAQGVHRSIRTDRAEDPGCRRRVLVWGEAPRLFPADRRGRACAALAEADCSSSVPGDGHHGRDSERRHLGRLRFVRRWRGSVVRAAAVQPSALHPLLLGHDRRTEVHRAWRRRDAHPAPQGASASLRHRRGRPRLLLHDLRLDDVELARLCAGVRRDAGLVRRIAVLSRRQCSVRSRRRDGHDALRDVTQVHRRGGEGRARADDIPPARDRAHHHVNRLAAGARRLRFRLRADQARRPPRVDLRRNGHRRTALRGGNPNGAGVARRAPGAGARNEGRSVRRGRPLGAASEGRARLHDAVSVDAGGFLERPRWPQVSRGVLRALSGRLVSRRLRRADRARRPRSSTGGPMPCSIPAACASARRRSTGRSSSSTRSSRVSSSGSSGTATNGSCCSSGCATGSRSIPDLEARIRQRIRENSSPRHVPARIVQVTDIPRTKSGKLVELAVRDVVHGRVVRNREALANPEALEQFRDGRAPAS